MKIESSINYWESNGLSFNPEKILIRLKKECFPELKADWKDQSRIHLESFFNTVKEKKLTPPDFIVESKWKLFSANSPTFLFTVPSKKQQIEGNVSRYLIEFKSKENFILETEDKIIEFLESLNYGKIKSDTKTELFCIANKNFKNYWNLKKS